MMLETKVFVCGIVMGAEIISIVDKLGEPLIKTDSPLWLDFVAIILIIIGTTLIITRGKNV